MALSSLSSSAQSVSVDSFHTDVVKRGKQTSGTICVPAQSVSVGAVSPDVGKKWAEQYSVKTKKPFTANFESHCTELLGSAGALNLQASLQEILGRWISFSLIATGGRPYESTPCVLPCRSARASLARDAAWLGLADGIHSGDAD